MPFKSQAQQRWMFWQHPEMADRWAHETPDIKDLPQHVGDRPSTGGARIEALKRQRQPPADVPSR